MDSRVVIKRSDGFRAIVEWDDREPWPITTIKAIGGWRGEKLDIVYPAQVDTRESKTLQLVDKRLDVENIERLGLKMLRDGDDVDEDGKPFLELPFLLVMRGQRGD